MFSQHVQRFGDLHIVVLNAGVGEVGGCNLHEPELLSMQQWPMLCPLSCLVHHPNSVGFG